MWKPPVPADERERLEELRRLDILLTTPEEPLDRITTQLARIFEVPGAFISFIDEDTQYYKSEIGLPPQFAGTRTEPREISLCSYVVGTNEPLVVEDLTRDRRFCDNPAVLQFGLRFYAGAPLRGERGLGVGSLCIVDHQPRTITAREQQMLGLLAEGVMAHVKLQVASRQLVDRSRRIERELEQARQVQRFLLPPACVDADGWRLRHRYRPATQLGGDFIDVARLDDGGLVAIIADVSGHGVSAALTAMMAKAAFSRAGASDPVEILSAMNRDLCGLAPPGCFITALTVVVRPGAREVMLASAGHPHPLLVDAREVVALPNRNDPPLLIAPDAEYATRTVVPLAAGQRLLAFTDGAVEVRDASGTMLHTDGFVRLAREAAATGGEAYLDDVLARVHAYGGDRLADDLALVLLEAI